VVDTSAEADTPSSAGKRSAANRVIFPSIHAMKKCHTSKLALDTAAEAATRSAVNRVIFHLKNCIEIELLNVPHPKSK
jgi:hypothetical protein